MEVTILVEPYNLILNLFTALGQSPAKGQIQFECISKSNKSCLLGALAGLTNSFATQIYSIIETVDVVEYIQRCVDRLSNMLTSAQTIRTRCDGCQI